MADIWISVCLIWRHLCTAILECSLKQVSEVNRHIDTIAALMIELDRFIDDLPRIRLDGSH